MGLEHEAAAAVLPGALEGQLEPSVGVALEAVLGDGRPGDVLAEPFELSAIASVDALLGVDVDAAHLGDGHVIVGRSLRLGLARRDEPERGLPGTVPRDGDALGGSGVAGGEAWLVEGELGGRVVRHLGVEGAARLVEELLDALGGPPGNGGNLRARRGGQGVEEERASLVFSNVDAVQCEHVEVDVESERAVGARDAGDGAGERLAHAGEPEGLLGAVFSERLSSPTNALTTSAQRRLS
jgi:hypothetical protein